MIQNRRYVRVNGANSSSRNSAPRAPAARDAGERPSGRRAHLRETLIGEPAGSCEPSRNSSPRAGRSARIPAVHAGRPKWNFGTTGGLASVVLGFVGLGGMGDDDQDQLWLYL